MKIRKSQYRLVTLFIAAALLLSACEVNIITDIKSDGSGSYTQEIGFQANEASMNDLDVEEEDFCAKESQDLPPNTIIRKETRDENETWCVYEAPFASLDDLQAIYSMTDTRINDISLVDGKLTYDISLDLSGDTGSSDMPITPEIYWTLTMPGRVVEDNATEHNKNTLRWKLVPGMVNNIRAVSEPGGVNLGGDVLWYVLGGGAFLCLCCLIPLVIVGLVFFFIKRKKNASTSNSSASQTDE